MRLIRVFRHRWQSVFRKSRAEADLTREIDLHIEELAKEYIATGVSESEARLAARREFGAVSLTAEQCRDKRRINLLEELRRDVIYGLRALRKSPAFTLTALLSLALGIGANTAIYSFLDAVMLRALPIPHPENLVVLNWRAHGWPDVAHSQHGDGYKLAGGVQVSGNFPYGAWQSLLQANDSFADLFAFAGAGRLNLVVANQASLGEGEYVSGNYFSGIGAPPAAGRLLSESDDRASAPPAAVISYPFWQRHFNGAASAVGQTVIVNRHSFTVAGVTAPEFYGVNPSNSPDIFLPLHYIASLDPRLEGQDWFHEGNTYWLEMMGRLRPGVSFQRAEIAAAASFRHFVVTTATKDKERANLPQLWLEEGGSGIDSLRRQYSKPLYVLLTMTMLILAIACANVANLLLSRSVTRRREIAVRLSLGAGRWRVVRQLLTESVLLAVSGGIGGLLAAELGIRFLTWLLSNGNNDFTLHAGVDFRILLFAVFLSFATGVGFGLLPALQATKVDVVPALKESRVNAARVHRFGLPFGLSHVLITGQIALSLLLVIAAGLFVTTLRKLHSVSVGFNIEKILVFSLNAPQAGYDGSHSAAFYEGLRERFARIPGVSSATMTDMPLVAGSSSRITIQVPGIAVEQDKGPSTSVTISGPAFFDTMQIPILLGRGITARDTVPGSASVVVNETFAKKYFADRNPLGRHFASSDKKPFDFQIVGVARNSLYASLTSEVPPLTYIPWAQVPPGWILGGMYFEVRTPGNPLALANTVREIVHQADARVPIADVATQVQYIDSTISSERTFAHLCTCFGLLALLIASVGLYGTMAYTVARRTNEIGIRIALGAQRGHVIWTVLREVLALLACGLVAGILIAWQSSQLVASFLFGVRAHDLAIFGISAAILTLCALAAGYAPARRASRIDPMEALRQE